MPRDRQRGNTLLLALIVMSALATLGSLTVVSVQSSLKASTNDRSQAIALYAAESGAAVALNYLRSIYTSTAPGAMFTPALTSPPALLGNNVQPGGPGNPFSPEQKAWYVITIANNPNDPGGPLSDTDSRVTVRSAGYGPQGATAIVEWDVGWPSGKAPPSPPYPNGYGLTLFGWHVVNL